MSKKELNTQHTYDFDRISKAIRYVNDNFKQQPSLDQIAEHVHLSPSHFQKMFTDWVGISPKKFLQYTTVSYAKNLIRKEQPTLFETSFQSGLSSTSRLHDLFISIEAMTPAEFKNEGKNLAIQYDHFHSPFGMVFYAATQKGICHLAFVTDVDQGLQDLVLRFPQAKLVKNELPYRSDISKVLNQDFSDIKKIKLHLKGTPFQMKVWEALLQIPLGELNTYGQLATQVGDAKASRAVGTAIGNNPVAFLIPCHRVIRTSGKLGGYRWGTDVKSMIIGWEASKIHES